MVYTRENCPCPVLANLMSGVNDCKRRQIEKNRKKNERQLFYALMPLRAKVAAVIFSILITGGIALVPYSVIIYRKKSHFKKVQQKPYPFKDFIKEIAYPKRLIKNIILL